MKKQTQRKIISLILIIVLIFTFIPAVSANTTSDLAISNGVLIKYNGKGGAVTIPNGVTAIGNSAFYWCENLTSVTIPNSVTTIGREAFRGCTSLTSVTIPNSVTTIDDSAFHHCTNMTSVTIGNAVTTIGDSAFIHCESLKSVIIPNSVKSIATYAFGWNESLTSVTIGNAVTTIGDSAFIYCESLKNVTIPNSVTAIGREAFGNGFYSIDAIFGTANSAAQRYARENDIFFAIGTPDYSKPNNPSISIIQAVAPIQHTNNRYLSTVAHDSGLQTFVNADGSISVFDTNNAIVYEYSAIGEFIKTHKFTKEMNLVGAFTKDKDGNYYVAYGKDLEETERLKTNFILVKYSKTGEKLKEFSNGGVAFGHIENMDFENFKEPFKTGCRLEISGDMIAVYFARHTFNLAYYEGGNTGNHNMSSGYILNINTFEQLNGNIYDKTTFNIPFVSHSFNQFILPIENGFVIADHGDEYPRAFAFEKVVKGQLKNQRIDSFEFKGGESSPVHYNWTFAELGGVAKTPSGYIFVGSYETNDVVQAYNNDSRNLFLLTMNEDLTVISNPIWITNYTTMNTETAVAPKIVQLDTAKYLLMWEVYNPREKNTKTCMAMVNDKGEIITPIKELGSLKLNGYDVLRYNVQTGLVHWATGSDANDEIKLYSFDPLKEQYHAPIPAGAKAGDIFNSPITVSINGEKIPSHNVNGKMAVNVDDLQNYGFIVEYRKISKSYSIIGFDKDKKVTPLTIAGTPGSIKTQYYYTDKKVYINGNQVETYEANNKVFIFIDDLSPFVNKVWDGVKSESVLTTKAIADTPQTSVTADLTAIPTALKFVVNGKEMAFDAYTILGSNYIKLRDLGMALNGMEEQFNVTWNSPTNVTSLTKGEYKAVGGELSGRGKEFKNPQSGTAEINVDGKVYDFDIYVINDANYFKFSDVMQALNINYNSSANAITIDVGRIATAADFEIKDGVLIKYTGTAKNIIIPDAVKTLGFDCFAYNNNITKVRIPSSVTEIYQGAFFSCSKLETIVVPSSVTKIAGYAFESNEFVTVYTPKDSAAHKYAVEHNVKFSHDTPPTW